MLSVVCWRWAPRPNYRSTYGPETVNTLRRMVQRHYPHPHRFICVTDDPQGIDPDIEIVPLWTDFAELEHPYGPKFPNCYRRLRAFHPEIGRVFGERFVSIDLDCVITADVTPVWNRPEDIVLWGGTHETTPYNGSMLLMTAGARPQVWTEFHPVCSPRHARRAGFFGSDQAWISYVLGPHEARWTHADGVYSWRLDCQPPEKPLPDNARIVLFHGRYDPWSPHVRDRCPWVRLHYR